MPEPAEPGPSGLHLQWFSTPHHFRSTTVEVKTPTVSEVSAAESEQEQQMSGVEAMQCSDYSSCKMNLSIDITNVETESDQEDYEDPDYEPSFNFSIEAVLPEDVEEIAEDVAFQEAEYGLENDGNTIDENEDVSEEEDVVRGVKTIKTHQECHELSQSIKCIVFLTQLKFLASLYVDSCKTDGCCKSIDLRENFVGSAMFQKWLCSDDHISESCCSKPVLNKRLHSGDCLVCATILLSGNNYSTAKVLYGQIWHT